MSLFVYYLLSILLRLRFLLRCLVFGLLSWSALCLQRCAPLAQNRRLLLLFLAILSSILLLLFQLFCFLFLEFFTMLAVLCHFEHLFLVLSELHRREERSVGGSVAAAALLAPDPEAFLEEPLAAVLVALLLLLFFGTAFLPLCFIFLSFLF